MKILIFHGYLLRGTGSNIYNASLASAMASMGHEVHLLCQDAAAAELPFVDAYGEWSGGLSLTTIREPVRCTAYRPDIGRVLPLYVADTYEGFDARPFPDLTDEELAQYIDANVAAVREVAARVEPDVALANHLVMGPAILARGLPDSIPYAVKIHGSALEYTVKPNRRRFMPYAEEGLARAGGVLVGSRHTGESLWEAMGDAELPQRTRLGPPGVDVHSFRPRDPDDAALRLRELAERLAAGDAAGWGGERGAADALRSLDPRNERLVGFVGKLIISKGIDLLLAAWPLVVSQVADARLCVVGFGTYRDGVQQIRAALAAADLGQLREIARRGRELEDGPPGELEYLAAFLDGLEGERRADYLDAAPGAAERIHFTGRLEHSDLPFLLPALDAQIVPSTFPEAFGMVAAEAAACGALPLSASHSGLAEVTRTLEEAVPAHIAPLLRFDRGPDAVEAIAARLTSWLRLHPGERAETRMALSRMARERYGWEKVADGVIAAAEGRLGDLPEP